MIREKFKTQKGNQLEVQINYEHTGHYIVLISKNHDVLFEARFCDPTDTHENPDAPQVNYAEMQRNSDFIQLVAALRRFVISKD
jgi:hypothetical protein